MTTLIGVRCTHSNVLSRDVLITRFPVRKFESHKKLLDSSQEEAHSCLAAVHHVPSGEARSVRAERLGAVA